MGTSSPNRDWGLARGHAEGCEITEVGSWRLEVGETWASDQVPLRRKRWDCGASWRANHHNAKLAWNPWSTSKRAERRVARHAPMRVKKSRMMKEEWLLWMRPHRLKQVPSHDSVGLAEAKQISTNWRQGYYRQLSRLSQRLRPCRIRPRLGCSWKRWCWSTPMLVRWALRWSVGYRTQTLQLDTTRKTWDWICILV